MQFENEDASKAGIFHSNELIPVTSHDGQVNKQAVNF